MLTEQPNEVFIIMEQNNQMKCASLRKMSAHSVFLGQFEPALPFLFNKKEVPLNVLCALIFF